MRHILLLYTVLFISVFSASAQFDVTGGIGKAPYKYSSKYSLPGSTGIEEIYLLNTLTNATIEYKTATANIVRFYKYTTSTSDKVLIPASDISNSINGDNTVYTIRNLNDSKGYFAEVNGQPTAVIWIIDYSQHLPQINSVDIIEADDKCERVQLVVKKSDELLYYGTSGTAHRITREYVISYNTVEWDKNSKQFVDKTVTTTPSDIGRDKTVDAPLTDTKFSVIGDTFATYFGIEKQTESPLYQSIAVKGEVTAEQTTKEGGVTTELGGSAPAEIHFYGHGNINVDFYTWKIYKDTDTENAIDRYTDQDINYTFTGEGRYIVELAVTNIGSGCNDTIRVELSIEESVLERPTNYLVLGETREFKFPYKSLLNFKCSIFNRWGNLIYTWTDPSKGWDGRYKGRYVSPGVYYYVAEAQGAGGKKHKRSGDINVVQKK